MVDGPEEKQKKGLFKEYKKFPDDFKDIYADIKFKKEKRNTKSGTHYFMYVARYKGRILSAHKIKASDKVYNLKRNFIQRGTTSFNPEVKSVDYFTTGVKRFTYKSQSSVQGQPTKVENFTKPDHIKKLKDKSNVFTQVVAHVNITYKGRNKTFTGYSEKLGATKKTETLQKAIERAYNNAIKQATTAGFIRYDNIHQATIRVQYAFVTFV